MKNRYYIAHDPNFPEGDLWVEMTGTSCGDPELQIRGKNEDGPVTVLNLSLAEACRLEKVLMDKFINYSGAYLQRSETEE